METIRGILLKEKEREISDKLNTWVQKEQILMPEEQLTFSLKIERSSSLVYASRTKVQLPIKLSVPTLLKKRGKIVPTKPARIDNELAMEIISMVHYEPYRVFMHDLLIINKNAPLLVPLNALGGQKMNSLYENINRLIGKVSLSGVYYRLLRNSAPGPSWMHYYQLFTAQKQ